MTDENESVERLETATEIEALFVQNAHGMTYQNRTIHLSGVAPTTLMFSDRPDRVTGHVPTEEFVDSWREGKESFADIPPNAVLSIFTEEEVHEVIVRLMKFHITKKPPKGGWEPQLILAHQRLLTTMRY